MRPNGIGNVTRRQMSVVLFRHARVLVAELGGDHAHRHAAHRQGRCMGVSEDVEARGRGDHCPVGGLGEWPLLMRCAPTLSV